MQTEFAALSKAALERESTVQAGLYTGRQPTPISPESEMDMESLKKLIDAGGDFSAYYDCA